MYFEVEKESRNYYPSSKNIKLQLPLYVIMKRLDLRVSCNREAVGRRMWEEIIVNRHDGNGQYYHYSHSISINQ